MKLFGSLTELVAAVFRKDSQAVTLRPSQSTTYTASRDIQLPPGDSDHALVSATSTSTLTNKTLTSPTITVRDNVFTLQDNSDNTKQAQFQCSGITAGQTRTFTLPDADGTFITSATAAFSDSQFTLQDNSDATKQAKFECSGISTGTTRTFTLPNASDTLAVLGTAQTFSATNTFSGTVINTGDVRIGSSISSNLGRIGYQSAASSNKAFLQHTIESTANYAIGVDSSNFFILGNLSAADTWDKKAIQIANSGIVTTALGLVVPTSTVASSNVYSGTWTLTVSNTSNIDGTTPIEGHFMRVGNVVTCSCTININVTTASSTATSFEFTLPVTTTVSASQKVNGFIGTGESTTNTTGVIKGVTGASRGKAAFHAQTTTDDEYKMHFTYIVE